MPTTLLHAALLSTVLWQLLAADWVERPRNGALGNLLFDIHQLIGLATLALVIAFWLRSAVRRNESPLGNLFPWLNAAARRAIFRDFRHHIHDLRKRRLPTFGVSTPPESAIHGLGLLAALAMGVSGAWLLTNDEHGGLVLKVCRALSNLMWAYVIGHVGIAVLHQFLGHRILRGMFGRKADIPQPCSKPHHE